MIQNKKGLSDIVTTALIILLVAVAVAAIWAFVSPALRGTGIQFTKTQVCVSNLIEPITCKGGVSEGGTIPGTVATASTATTAGSWFKDVQVRRTLTDGVAVPESITVSVDGKYGSGTSTTATNKWFYALNYAAVPTVSIAKEDTESNLNLQQGQMVMFKPVSKDASATEPSSQASQAKVTTTYRLPDNTIVVCNSLPITCD